MTPGGHLRWGLQFETSNVPASGSRRRYFCHGLEALRVGPVKSFTNKIHQTNRYHSSIKQIVQRSRAGACSNSKGTFRETLVSADRNQRVYQRQSKQDREAEEPVQQRQRHGTPPSTSRAQVDVLRTTLW